MGEPVTPVLRSQPRRVATFVCPAGESPQLLLERLAAWVVSMTRLEGRPGAVWLDSGGPVRPGATHSVLTGFPVARVRVEDLQDARFPEVLDSFVEETSDPTSPEADAAVGPHFRGGWLGFLGYEAVEAFEPVRLSARRDTSVPLSGWGLYPVWFSHEAGSREIVLWSRLSQDGSSLEVPALSTWIHWAQQAVAGRWPVDLGERFVQVPSANDTTDAVIEQAARSFSRAGFMRAVETVKATVQEGEVFQANLAHRLSVDTNADPFVVYSVLRRLNPSPFMAFLEEDWGAVVSNSPERLFSVRNEAGERVVEVRPIAGTRPRGGTIEEDRRLRESLRTSRKERAEHTMLVDLVRNDIGRVARAGSVRVQAFQSVEEYSHVHHLVSRVEGRLRPGVGVSALLQALFPGGTITGAPKLRSIEVIDRVEPVARGPYTGSVGYVNPDGSMDLNILIRTLVFADGVAHACAGAGIVADSDPRREYEETLHKAAAMMTALAQVEQGDRETREPVLVPATRMINKTSVEALDDEEALAVHAARRGRLVEGRR